MWKLWPPCSIGCGHRFHYIVLYSFVRREEKRERRKMTEHVNTSLSSMGWCPSSWPQHVELYRKMLHSFFVLISPNKICWLHCANIMAVVFIVIKYEIDRMNNALFDCVCRTNLHAHFGCDLREYRCCLFRLGGPDEGLGGGFHLHSYIIFNNMYIMYSAT